MEAMRMTGCLRVFKYKSLHEEPYSLWVGLKVAIECGLKTSLRRMCAPFCVNVINEWSLLEILTQNKAQGHNTISHNVENLG